LQEQHSLHAAHLGAEVLLDDVAPQPCATPSRSSFADFVSLDISASQVCLSQVVSVVKRAVVAGDGAVASAARLLGEQHATFCRSAAI
jgi:hypothetical protein